MRRFMGLRKAAVVVASLAIAGATLVGVAGPASATVSSASATPSPWAPGTSPAATVSIVTGGTSTTSPLVVVEWDWTVSFGALTSDTATPTGSDVYTCNTGIKFTTTTTWTGTVTGCTYDQGGSGDPSHHRVTLAGAVTSGDITVYFPANTVTAVANSRGYGIWTVNGNYQFRVYLTAAEGAAPPPALITIDFDGNSGKCATSKLTDFMGAWGKAPKATDCTKSGFNFAGWNTSANGKGIWIVPEGNINFTGDNRVYAQWADPTVAVKPPGVPTDVKATGKWNRITVNWNAPADQGSFPITNYLVTALPSNKVCITNLIDRIPTQCTFNNVVPGVKYTFVAQALNGAGWGERSAASNQAAAFNLRVDSFKRVKTFFGLGGQKINVSGLAPGYAGGTKLTPWIQIGSNAKWVAQKAGASAVANEKFGWEYKLQRNQNNATVAVKFTADGENFSNVVTISPGK